MIVVTGLIGSGKSTVVALLEQSGLSAIRADEWFKTSGLVPPCKPFEDYRWELFEETVAIEFIRCVHQRSPSVIELPLSSQFTSIVQHLQAQQPVYLIVVESALAKSRALARDTNRDPTLTDKIYDLQLKYRMLMEQFSYIRIVNSGSKQDLENSVLHWSKLFR